MQQSKLIIVVFCIAILGFTHHGYKSYFTGETTVRILDVEQGDSIFITCPSGKKIIVDGGPNTKLLEHLPRYMSFFDRTIDLLIISHPDSDHITAIPELLKRYTVKNVLLAGTDHTSARYGSLLELIKTSSINVLLADPTKDIIVDNGLIIDVIHPNPRYVISGAKGNDQSIVLKLQTNNGSMLLTGDIEKDAELAVLKAGENIEATYLKVAHHGSRTSSATGFILQTNPTVALFSAAGDKHPLNHPHQDIVERYRALHIQTRSTHIEGTIEITL